MSENKETKDNIGKIEWCDLTVNNAERIKDFYCDVVAWDSAAVAMGEYNDFNINLPNSADTVAGICHARGSNSNLPAQWLMYVRVKNVSESAASCHEAGGKVLDGPRAIGSSQFCVIQDPEGAALALISE